MRMQEPEQWQQSGQASQEDSEYRTGYAENAQYAGGYESEQQQKIYPQEELRLRGTALGIFAIILSSIGFFLAVAGIVGSSIVLEYANGQQAVLVGGVMGLVSSILVVLVCVGIFSIAVVTLALRSKRVRRRMGVRL
ncbi:MAG: hypothetical protein E6I91_07100 [Chloroflexi bacterium]|nr:MAG: hypothetical protein E6I91_07100 [Chloroflexota bacterium]